jgi:hypothetical protein
MYANAVGKKKRYMMTKIDLVVKYEETKNSEASPKFVAATIPIKSFPNSSCKVDKQNISAIPNMIRIAIEIRKITPPHLSPKYLEINTIVYEVKRQHALIFTLLTI